MFYLKTVFSLSSSSVSVYFLNFYRLDLTSQDKSEPTSGGGLGYNTDYRTVLDHILRQLVYKGETASRSLSDRELRRK